MHTPTAIACALLLASFALRPAAAAGIVRCESADGRVTYSNTECPAGSRAVRSVDLAPPVVVHDKGRAAAKPPAAPAGAPKAARGPAADDAELRAQLAKQRAECDARLKEIERLRQDRDGAAGEAGATAQQALRRAEDDYRALCPQRR
jgi:hypothetical protein